MSNVVCLAKYVNSWRDKGANKVKRILWFAVNSIFFRCSWNIFSGLKVNLLRLFGAQIGKGVNIKTNVNIKCPWMLEVGDYVWIGENVWIDNNINCIIGSNVVLSQGSMLLCGNHNYKKTSFDLIVGKIILEDGVWIGARALVCPGVTAKSHSILTVGSITSKDMEAYGIYQGNPAMKVKTRIINDNSDSSEYRKSSFIQESCR